MKGRKRITALIAALMAALVLFPAAALAAGVSVTADPIKADPGDTVILTVVVSGSGLGAAQGTFTYDPSVLTFVSASGGASDGFIDMVAGEKGGADSLTAVVKFTATAGGESVINVDIDKVLSYDGDALEGGTGAVSITVTGTPETPTEEKPAVDITSVGIIAHNVLGAQGDMYVWRTLEERTLPSRYADRQVEYAGEFIGGAAIPDTEFPILLYLTDPMGENGAYYIYEAERDTLYPYETVSSPSASYTIMLAPEGLEIPEGWTETEIDDDGDIFTGWTAGEEGVYLVYARNSAGETGFYIFDMAGESVQRYIAPVIPEAEPEPEPTAAPEDTAGEPGTLILPYFALYIAGGVAVLLIATIVVLAVSMGAKKARLERSRRERAARAAKAEESDKTEKTDM